MSTTDPEFNPEDFEGLQPAQTAVHNAELRKLRKEAQRSKELEAKVADLERREAFARAGVPLDNPATEYLIRGYQGELTAEAIKAEAVKIGIVASTSATPQEVAGHEAVQAAATGGTPPTGGPDYQARLAELQKKQFGPTDEAGRNAAMQELRRLSQEAGARIPIYPQSP